MSMLKRQSLVSSSAIELFHARKEGSIWLWSFLGVLIEQYNSLEELIGPIKLLHPSTGRMFITLVSLNLLFPFCIRFTGIEFAFYCVFCPHKLITSTLSSNFFFYFGYLIILINSSLAQFVPAFPRSLFPLVRVHV